MIVNGEKIITGLIQQSEETLHSKIHVPAYSESISSKIQPSIFQHDHLRWGWKNYKLMIKVIYMVW